MDKASARLLKYLYQDRELNHVLLVCAYRENEIDEKHPLNDILKDVKDGQDNIMQISLMPLAYKDTERFVSNALEMSIDKIQDLSEDLYRKSAGNPLFLKQLLVHLYDEGLLSFDFDNCSWLWDIESIRQLRPGDDVIDIILKKIKKLTKDTYEAIRLASCIASRFDLETLAAVYGKSLMETADDLMVAVKEGLLLITNNDNDQKNMTYEFLHDKIQQTLYSSISEQERKEKHIEIGRLMLNKYSSFGIEDKILFIMDHINRGIDLVKDKEEAIKLAEYNLLAAKKAKATAAYESALKYLRTAKDLIGEKAWDEYPKLSHDIYLELAQMEFLAINYDTAENLFQIVLSRLDSELEKANIYAIKIFLYGGIGKYQEAVETGLQALKRLGVNIKIKPSIWAYLKEMITFKWLMANKSIEDLAYLPEMEDPLQIKIAELLNCIANVTMTCYPNLHGLIILKASNHCLKYGNTPVASTAYLGYSIISASILGDYLAGEKYGDVSIKIVDKYNINASKCIVYFVIGALIYHWTKHAKEGLEYLRKAASWGIEAGNLLVSGYAYNVLLENNFFTGKPLIELMEEINEKLAFGEKTNHDNLIINGTIYASVISALIGKEVDSFEQSICLMDKDSLVEMATRDSTSKATYLFYKMMLNYMADNYEKALISGDKIKDIIGAITGFMLQAEYIFYYSLLIIAIYPKLSFKGKIHYLKILKQNIRKLKKWARYCNENFQHKYLLVMAELAGLKRKNEEAMILYDEAINLAKVNSYIKDEALANELAAKFYISLGLVKNGKAYIHDSYDCYNSWQAYSKARELKNKYSEYFEDISMKKRKNDLDSAFKDILSMSSHKESHMEKDIDSEFLESAVENLVRETDINRLFLNFLDIALKCVGADKGYLIMEKRGDLYIEAIINRKAGVASTETIYLEEYNDISKAVVRYVARTSEAVVLDCRNDPGFFAEDSYIAESNPGAIACIPLLLQGIPFGLVYIENSLLSGIFSSKQLQTLKLLSIQVAYAKKLQSYLEADSLQGYGFIDNLLVDDLTEREIEVLRLIAQGYSNKEIGEHLSMTVNTVKTHIKNIYGKLLVSRRVQAVEKAKRLKIL